MRLLSTEGRPVNCVSDTGAGLNLIGEEELKDDWFQAIKSAERFALQGAPNHKLTMVGTTTLRVRIGETRVRVVFRAVRQLAVSVSLVTSFIDK